MKKDRIVVKVDKLRDEIWDVIERREIPAVGAALALVVAEWLEVTFTPGKEREHFRRLHERSVLKFLSPKARVHK